MPTPASRAEELAERLNIAGLSPAVREQSNHLFVEVEAPDPTSSETWEALLGALEGADHFGHRVSPGGTVIWAAIHKGDPRGRGDCPGAWPSALGS
jgi:hypothetical protein